MNEKIKKANLNLLLLAVAFCGAMAWGLIMTCLTYHYAEKAEKLEMQIKRSAGHWWCPRGKDGDYFLELKTGSQHKDTLEITKKQYKLLNLLWEGTTINSIRRNIIHHARGMKKAERQLELFYEDLNDRSEQ